jgi:hypothetical protein
MIRLRLHRESLLKMFRVSGRRTLVTIAALQTLLLISVGCGAADDKLEDAVVADGYFSNNNCVTYLNQVPPAAARSIMEDMKALAIGDMIGYVSGQDTLIGRFEKTQHAIDLTISPVLKNYKQYGVAEATTAGVERMELLYKDKSPNGVELFKAYERYLDCRVIESAVGKSPWNDYVTRYMAYAKARPESAHIGYFDVTTTDSYYRKTVNTGNRFIEPKPDADSRFFLVDATFKNTDTESRLPSAGSLFINYNNKEYEYDLAEPIMLEGYNIWFRSVNPLITMHTKIVYRIPNEIEGEVFWQPGRNSNKTRLWLGYVKAAK